jgi:hypothetical protein
MSVTIKFEVDKINQMMNYLRKLDNSMNKLLSELEINGSVILIGGAIRDALKQNYNPRDIDMILKLNRKANLDYILEMNNIKYRKNRFGGYKIFFDKTTFDIWTIENHWAFKNSLYEEKIENIEKTTFLNYDSLVYDYSSKELYKQYYDKCREEKVIDIIGNDKYIKENPSPDINIMRMLKIKRETNYQLSNRSYEYIYNYYKNCNNHNSNIDNILETAYLKHYGQIMNTQLKMYIIEFFSELEKGFFKRV